MDLTQHLLIFSIPLRVLPDIATPHGGRTTHPALADPSQIADNGARTPAG